MGDQEAKRIILARRARFVAAALAGLNAAMCGGTTDGDPQVCLGAPFQQDAGSGTTEDLPRQQDAGRDADADAEPQPCLSPQQDAGGDGGDGG